MYYGSQIPVITTDFELLNSYIKCSRKNKFFFQVSIRIFNFFKAHENRKMQMRREIVVKWLFAAGKLFRLAWILIMTLLESDLINGDMSWKLCEID